MATLPEQVQEIIILKKRKITGGHIARELKMQQRTVSRHLRGCLKKIDKIDKIDKIGFSIVLGVVSLYGSGKSGDFEQSLVWLGLNSQI